MSYELASNKDTTRELDVDPAGTKTVGEAGVVSSKVGFWFSGGVSGTKAPFIYKAKRVFADADGAATYSAGDAVYDAAAAPTGTVNKTSATGRTIVGYALKTYPAGTTKIEVEDFDGTRAVV